MKNEFNFADNIDKTKITLIRHYMAEKGMDLSLIHISEPTRH